MGPLRASFVAVIVCALFDICESHVALTFPPARKYDLDFLDNSRTKAPCGMPKGNIRTSLLAGSKLNVTWHLGYPHKGGFKLELLDNLERPVLDLTPTVHGSEFVSNDATAQSYQIQLPNDYACNDCTLRLIRQALEWGNNYKFWSCADVDIKSRKEYKETCSSHGKSLVGRCKCDKLYSGDRCQYKDECWENSDCGIRGKCINTHATTAPQQQCYCDLGWFGVGCNRKSPVKITEIDFDVYNKRILSDTFRLYWRILKEHKELEVILVVNGTNYAAIGWRPTTLTSSCKNFPFIGSAVAKSTDLGVKPEPNSEPEPSAEPKSEPEPTIQVKAEPLPTLDKLKVETTRELKSEPEPKSEPEAKPEPTPEPIPEVDLVTTTLAPKYKKTYSRRSASPSPRALLAFDDADKVETSVSFRVSSKQGRRKRDFDNEPVVKSSQKHVALPEPTPQHEPVAEPKSEPVSTAEHKLEPVPTSEPKSEPEPTSEPTSKPEPSAEPWPSAEPRSKPEPTADLNPKYSSDITKSSPPDSFGAPIVPKESLNPYTPRHDFNAMDCTDIIIGFARNTSSRINDYYTRDRSTPRIDSFWGGKNDLTAAMGFEKDGITTILFRRKLEATEPSDHTIEKNIMHLIWAQGQEIGKYVHVPKSGIESSNSSVKDFYKADELKYHGHGTQRGFTTINFYDEKHIVEVDSQSGDKKPVDNSFCGGEWKTPHACSIANSTCEYSAKWEYFPRNDDIRFTISTKNSQYWTGIGFSNDMHMPQTDAILGWIEKSGKAFLMDTWINGYTYPLVDASQDLFNISGRLVDGITTLSFTRKRISNDLKDLSFTDVNCLFMFYLVKGGIFNGVSKKIRQHEVIPIVSAERICIRSCGHDDRDDLLYQAPESSKMGYKMQVKIVNLGENFNVPELGTSQYDELTNRINENFNLVFRNLPGYKSMAVQNLEENSNNLITMMYLQMDRTIEKGGSPTEIDEQQAAIKALLQNIVESGRVGALRVDPDYWRFEPDSVINNVVPDTPDKFHFFNLSGTKLYIVLGCFGALILLVVIQASCTLYKMTRKPPSQKGHLLHNSAWKDYSTASTNYAFDAFENDENHLNGRGRSETLPARGQLRNGRPQGRPPSVPTYLSDTRSLQRPRGNNPSPGPQLERSTLSLPRTSYDRNRHQVHDNNGSLHPDFYFMPSQRKYSGEVVRVYVDYNNKTK